MKIIYRFLLPLTILCSCDDVVQVESKQDWGFMNPETEALMNQGIELTRQGKFEESINVYKKGLEIEPENVLLFLEMGNSYNALNNIDEAETYYNKVLSSTPGPIYPLVYPNLSNLKLGKSDYLSAIKYGKIGLEKCEKDVEKSACAVNVAAAYLNLDSCEQSKKYLELTKKLRKGNLTNLGIKVENGIKEYCQGSK